MREGDCGRTERFDHGHQVHEVVRGNQRASFRSGNGFADLFRRPLRVALVETVAEHTSPFADSLFLVLLVVGIIEPAALQVYLV